DYTITRTMNAWPVVHSGDTSLIRENESKYRMSALGHVWTAPPWQELSDAAAALVGCGHVCGLFVRPVWPLAIMLCAESSCPRQFLQNFKTPSSLPGLTSLNRSGFDATSL